ncbi:MAG: hypothetical protein F6K26_20940 [Moorea sp. SIO2I5]|nr:hypothetical protein [Moorena sp. SIO2I5]
MPDVWNRHLARCVEPASCRWVEPASCRWVEPASCPWCGTGILPVGGQQHKSNWNNWE